MYLVRLKPYNKNLGHLICDYIAPWGAKFVAGIWYEIDSAQAAEYLKTIRQRHEDQTSPLAFDVTDAEGAKEIIAAEKRAKLEKARPVQPVSVPAPRDVKTVASVALNAPEPTHVLEVDDDGDDYDDEPEDFSEPEPEPQPKRKAPAKRKTTAKRKATSKRKATKKSSGK